MTIKELKYIRGRAKRCYQCDKTHCPERKTGGFCGNEPVRDHEIIMIINELIKCKECEANENH